MDIVIIGTGNTATILGRKLKAAGHRIVQVFGRDAAAASALAYELETESTTYWAVVDRSADIYLVAVSDIAIAEIHRELHLPEGTVVHTAASVPLDALAGNAPHHGVFYPLQSLRKNSGGLPDIPVIIDAADPQTFEQLDRLGHSISDQVVAANDAERLRLHLAAVFCNNFVNHIYALMEDWCRREGLDFRLLLPLIRETAERVQLQSPRESQTGPALRGDENTIARHRALLAGEPGLLRLYELMTDSIRQQR
ncbi:DUF2520 domain-containing protein [Flaviaesturariibacter flavus]|uniref:DUF2520 domain-containing protein n=1 Tax=Flaviaesturariibacter flavus TaxID=2502780 RepID=A0A4R1BPN2_9BACT|nr:DUF2520 domain-containing protein [Flaviaesturariibacter flavus]TCJ19185.1 DUF2520 domain-containing protein [Flaviaesturariibacter flavus]